MDDGYQMLDIGGYHRILPMSYVDIARYPWISYRYHWILTKYCSNISVDIGNLTSNSNTHHRSSSTMDIDG